MDKIEVGEYVRFKNGLISKVTECIYSEDYIRKFKPNNRFIRYIKDKYGFDDLSGWRTKVNIVKHSKNIIDLIEVGDYVNGERVLSVDYESVGIEGFDFINPEDIKSIVTKEQFEEIEYVL